MILIKQDNNPPHLNLFLQGGIYAYVLEKSNRCRVTAITRSLYHPIQTHGLTINSEKYGHTKHWKPYRLVRSAQEAVDRNYRFIICCVKCLPDVEVSKNTACSMKSTKIH
jgi:2-dehydropantoate 2-reductase